MMTTLLSKINNIIRSVLTYVINTVL